MGTLRDANLRFIGSLKKIKMFCSCQQVKTEKFYENEKELENKNWSRL